jgi:hypothetical protein
MPRKRRLVKMEERTYLSENSAPHGYDSYFIFCNWVYNLMDFRVILKFGGIYENPCSSRKLKSHHVAQAVFL